MRQESLVGCGAAVLALSVLGIFAWRTSRREGLLDEAARMRQVYVALSLYEEQNDVRPALQLSDAQPYLARARSFVSTRDPYATAPGPYPIDAGLPDLPRTAPFRTSDSYLWAHRRAKRIRTAPWAEARLDPSLALLAGEWYGSSEPSGDFQAIVSGEFLRISMTGAAMPVRRTRGGPLGDALTLFRIVPSSR